MNQRSRIRCAYKVAVIAAEHLNRNVGCDTRNHPGTPFTFVRQYRRMSSMHRIAKARGYLCAEQLRQKMLHTLRAIETDVRWCRESLHAKSGIIEPQVIFNELMSLFDEFTGVEFDSKRKQVRCTTEPIELNDTYLGSFDIELDLRYLGQASCYRVVAREPNPASTNDSTTHPHVQSEQLCEGDAKAPINNAIRSGRLFDFFLIVRQTLQTYNRDSAYVSLEDWDGVECHECGSTVDEEDTSRCDDCENSMCTGCSIGCECCGKSFCDGCTKNCEGCEDRFCVACLMSCDRCDTKFCSSCLEEGLCDDCIEQKAEEEIATPEDEAKPPVSTVYTVGVGEAVVHA